MPSKCRAALTPVRPEPMQGAPLKWCARGLAVCARCSQVWRWLGECEGCNKLVTCLLNLLHEAHYGLMQGNCVPRMLLARATAALLVHAAPACSSCWCSLQRAPPSTVISGG